MKVIMQTEVDNHQEAAQEHHCTSTFIFDTISNETSAGLWLANLTNCAISINFIHQKSQCYLS